MIKISKNIFLNNPLKHHKHCLIKRNPCNKPNDQQQCCKGVLRLLHVIVAHRRLNNILHPIKSPVVTRCNQQYFMTQPRVSLSHLRMSSSIRHQLESSRERARLIFYSASHLFWCQTVTINFPILRIRILIVLGISRVKFAIKIPASGRVLTRRVAENLNRLIKCLTLKSSFLLILQCRLLLLWVGTFK